MKQNETNRFRNKCLYGFVLLIPLLVAGVYAAIELSKFQDGSDTADLSKIIESTSPIEIPFKLTEHNNIAVDSVFNKQHPMTLMFHTAANEVSLTQQTLEKMPEVELNLEGDSESWGGNSKIRFANGFELSLGQLQLDNVTVFESMHSGHQTDGKFGPQQLGSQFIEVDFENSKLLLHDLLPKKTWDWDRVELTIENGMMKVEGSIQIGDDVIRQQFLIHSGYSGFALLDDEFVAQHKNINDLEIIDESELTDAGGNILKTKKSLLPNFSFGEFEFDNVPVSFFDGAIGRQKFSVLGGDFLKRFDIVFDLKNRELYLKKSRYFAAEHL